MKTVKIVLTVTVVALIGLFLERWLINVGPPKTIDSPKSLYAERIESKIDSIKKMPAKNLSREYYLIVQATIAEDYRNGSFGLTSYKDGNIWKQKKDENINNQWNEILCKNLYSAYAPKFVEQAMYVFSSSEWKNDDIEFIRNEVKNLKSSSYLGNTGIVTSFDEINAILAKYDEINNFINACKGYTYPYYDMASAFPDVSGQIKKSRVYIANNLDNSYVNNCTRLKKGLLAIGKILFDKHINYLTNKINNYAASYGKFNSQPDYSKTIYAPLKNQVDALDNDIYGIDDAIFSNGYNSVYNLLGKFNKLATDTFKSKTK